LLYEDNFRDIQRGELFVSTKIGYLQEDADHGINWTTHKEKVMSKLNITENEFIGHNCYNPDFLSYQLESSRQNLG